MKNIAGIILAAGEGVRMDSGVPKVLHKICGKVMLKHMLDLLHQLEIKRSIVVIGHKQELVKEILKRHHTKIKTIRQPKLLGSADAVWQTRTSLANYKGDVLVVYGDTPLITYRSLKKLIQLHRDNQAACTILTAVTKNPTGLGRIVRTEDNRILKIVEEQDADTYERAIGEVNVGVYCFRAKELFSALEEVKCDNVKNEYYLTDTIKILTARRAKVESVYTEDEQEALGVNSRYDLSCANSVINKRNLDKLISRGVTIVDPATTFVYGEIEAGRDTIIYPHTVIEGKVKIGRACHIGPFAHLRSGTILEDAVQIGNFVEIVRARIFSGSKIKHHSYIGDAIVGKDVNIGAGTITANYDGKNKNPTLIGDGAFIGVGTILIAPVKVGKKAVTGAGSVLTKGKNVPQGVTVVGIPARILKKKRKYGKSA